MQGVKLSKSEALDIFVKSRLRETLSDRVATRCAWNDYVDGLQKSGHITRRQAETWINPFDNTRKKK